MQTPLLVSGDFFNVLGIQPVVGRVISPADDYRGCGVQGAVLSYAFWQREFGGRPDVLGTKLALNGHPFKVSTNSRAQWRPRHALR
jgi:putative ABC transport system permease protein